MRLKRFIATEIGTFLRECRLQSGRTLADGSALVGFDLKGVESGEDQISVCDIEALMRFYGLSEA